MKLKILRNQYFLNIVNANNTTDIIYQTEIENLANRRDNHSDLISQLIGRLYFTNEILYQLAAIIQTEFPENGFNWESQFFQVECDDYFERILNLKYDNIHNRTDKEEMKFVMKQTLMIIDRTPEDNSKIKKIVIQNLLKYEIS